MPSTHDEVLFHGLLAKAVEDTVQSFRANGSWNTFDEKKQRTIRNSAYLGAVHLFQAINDTFDLYLK